MSKLTIITGVGLRLVIDGACAISAALGRQVVIDAGGRDIYIDLPPTAAVTYL